MTATGFVLLCIAYSLYHAWEASYMHIPGWRAALVKLVGLSGAVSTVAGIATFLWRFMP